MKATVVRFDEELGYMHAADQLRCPRGVLYTGPNRDGHGSYRVVLPCHLSIGHDGDCVGASRLDPQITVCGLPMHDSPWTIAPDGAKQCPTCFDLEPAHEQDVLL